MKLSVFPALLTLIVTLAIGYLAYHLANSNSDANDLIVGIGTGISVFLQGRTSGRAERLL